MLFVHERCSFIFWGSIVLGFRFYFILYLRGGKEDTTDLILTAGINKVLSEFYGN